MAGKISYLHWPAWTAEGIQHGFSDGTLDSSVSAWPGCRAALEGAFGIESLLLQCQDHTSICTDYRGLEPLLSFIEDSTSGRSGTCADALVCTRRRPPAAGKLCYGLVTADCIPLIIRSGEAFALVHAGWRGLAGSIIENSLAMLGGKNQKVEVLIGPCAGPDEYEVGPEVVNSLGTTYRGRPGVPGKSLLDLVQTAKARIHSVCPNAAVHSTDICTIGDKRFHSYRRDGSKAGRNLTFLLSE